MSTLPDYAQARADLAAIIKAIGATMESTRLLARPDREASDWDKKALHFQCVISAPRMPGEPIVVHWSCGEAVPVHDAQREPRPAWFRSFHHGAALRDHLAAPRSVDGARGAEILRAAYKPDLVDVLQSCLTDSSDEGATFENWCGDLGYDTDSRKAYATWEACMRIARDMRRLFRGDFDRALRAAQEC